LVYESIETLENIIVEKNLKGTVISNLTFILKNILSLALEVLIPEYFDLVLSIIRLYPMNIKELGLKDVRIIKDIVKIIVMRIEKEIKNG